MHPGIYLTHAGEADWHARGHAALLHCGPGAALGWQSAAYVWRLTRKPPPLIQVAIPADRQAVKVPGMRVVRTRGLVTTIWRGMRVTPQAVTVLDLADQTRNQIDAIAYAADAVRDRIVTAQQLAAELASRSRHRHRRALRLAFGDIDAGMQSALEHKALNQVLRAHAIPPMDMQVPGDRGGPAGLGCRRDFESAEFGVILEVDGRVGHLGAARLEDHRRDRAAARSGKITLRAGWVDVDTAACALAQDLYGTFAARGFTGMPRRCGPRCRLQLPESAAI